MLNFNVPADKIIDRNIRRTIDCARIKPTCNCIHLHLAKYITTLGKRGIKLPSSNAEECWLIVTSSSTENWWFTDSKVLMVKSIMFAWDHRHLCNVRLHAWNSKHWIRLTTTRKWIQHNNLMRRNYLQANEEGKHKKFIWKLIKSGTHQGPDQLNSKSDFLCSSVATWRKLIILRHQI